MAKMKTTSLGVDVPKNRQEANEIVLKWQKEGNFIKKANLDSEERIAKEKDNLKNLINPKEKLIKDYEKSLQIFCEAHRDDLTDNRKYQQGDLGSAIVKWRKASKVKVTTKLKDNVMKNLKKILPAAITVKESINKDEVKKNSDLIEKIAGIEVTEYETFVIEMKGAENEKN